MKVKTQISTPTGSFPKEKPLSKRWWLTSISHSFLSVDTHGKGLATDYMTSIQLGKTTMKVELAAPIFNNTSKCMQDQSMLCITNTQQS